MVRTMKIPRRKMRKMRKMRKKTNVLVNVVIQNVPAV